MQPQDPTREPHPRAFEPARAADRTDAELPTEQLRELLQAAALPPGYCRTLADRYELIAPLGAGSMGQVWRARDRVLEREVAVKVLRPQLATAIDIDRLVAREGRLLARLSHPGIVGMLDAGRDGEHRFLVMELVRGSGLDQLIAELRQRRQTRGRPLRGADLLDLVGSADHGTAPLLDGSEPWPVAVAKTMAALARPLAAAHGVGVVHRDLKPANVHITGGGQPVLLDFGIGVATSAAPGTLTGDLFGTMCYAAPEQWRGVQHVGPHTDIYQFAVVAWELLTLEPCFPRGHTASEIEAIRTGCCRRPRQVDPTIDPRLEAIVLRAMNVQPARRYPSAAALGADLERFLAGQRPAAAAPLQVATTRLRRLARHGRGALWCGAALAAGLIGFQLARARSTPSVRTLEPDRLSVQVERPMHMVAFRVASDGDSVWCAPVYFVNDGGLPTPSRSLADGSTAIALHDIGDPARIATSIVSSIFVSADDPAAERRFASVVAAMERARQEVERRHGEWLGSDDFAALFAAGRGGADAGLPADAMLRAGVWHHEGLTGVAVAAAALAAPRDQAMVPAAPPTLALLVGIDRYAQPPSGDGPGDLRGAENDIGLVERLLVAQFGFDPAGIVKLVGPQATHEAIVRTIHDHLIQRAGPETQVVLWFSGHGSYIPDGSRAHATTNASETPPVDYTLVAYDSRAIAADGSYDVTDDELHSLLLALRTRHVLVVTDCCHAGGLLRGALPADIRQCPPGTRPLDLQRIRSFWPYDATPLRDDHEVMPDPLLVWIAACEALQLAGEKQTARGHFGTLSWYLARVLSDARPDTTWHEAVARVRALVAGEGTQPGQRPHASGDLQHTVLGGRRRPTPPGYQVDPLGVRSLWVGAGSLHGLRVHSELRLVDFDNRQLGKAVVDRLDATSCVASWQGDQPPPKVAMLALPLALGDAPPLRIALGPGVGAGLLEANDLTACCGDDSADYRIEARDGGFALCLPDGVAVRPLPADPNGMAVELLREYHWRSLWRSVAEPGRYQLRVTVTAATAEDVARFQKPAAQLHVHADPDSSTCAAVVGAAPLDAAQRTGGGLVRLEVHNLGNEDVHVAIVSVTENREVVVVHGRNKQNLLRAGDPLTKVVWVGRAPQWPADRPLVDRLLVIATRSYADFTAFASDTPIAATRGAKDVDDMPPYLREALGGARTRGGELAKGAWGIGYAELQVVDPDLFQAATQRLR